MICVSCWGIWWRHVNVGEVRIWLSPERKELSKWNKLFSLVSKVLCFRHTKQANKNVAATTYNDSMWTPGLKLASKILT